MYDYGFKIEAVNCLDGYVAGIVPITENEEQNHGGEKDGGFADMAARFFRLGHLHGRLCFCLFTLAEYGCHNQADDDRKANRPDNSSRSDGKT